MAFIDRLFQGAAARSKCHEGLDSRFLASVIRDLYFFCKTAGALRDAVKCKRMVQNTPSLPATYPNDPEERSKNPANQLDPASRGCSRSSDNPLSFNFFVSSGRRLAGQRQASKRMCERRAVGVKQAPEKSHQTQSRSQMLQHLRGYFFLHRLKIYQTNPPAFFAQRHRSALRPRVFHPRHDRENLA